MLVYFDLPLSWFITYMYPCFAPVYVLHCILHDIYLKSWHSSALKKVCWSSIYHIMSWVLNNNGEEGGGVIGKVCVGGVGVGCGVLPTSLTNVCVMCYICLLLLEKSQILPKAMDK